MKPIFQILGASLFPVAGAFAASYQPTALQNVFYQAAWQEFAEGIESDLQDPSAMESKADDFRILMYKAIGRKQSSFRYEYFHTTQDNSDCLNTQVTAYEGLFAIRNAADNMVSVSLKNTDVYVYTAQAEGCGPAL